MGELANEQVEDEERWLRLDLMLCGTPIRIETRDRDLHAVLARYYAPALLAPSAEPSVLVRVEEDVRILRGLPEQVWSGRRAAPQLELALIDMIFQLSGPGPILHAGFAVLQGHPILLTAPSGSGKSTMTRAALRAGADYVSDDLITIRSNQVHGFARSIRFSPIPADLEPTPEYLRDAHLDGYGLRAMKRRELTPIWWKEGRVVHSYPLGENPVVVVKVSRGPDEVVPMTPVERLVLLHEQAIVRAGEYDGCLGDGPGFALSWQDPDRAFELLRQQLSL